MNRLLRKIVAIAALVLGVSCLCYPFVSDAILSAAQQQVAKENIVAAEALDDGSREQLMNRARDYNDALASGMTYVSDPFDPAAPTPGDVAYEEALSLPGQEAMAVIRVPSVGVYVPLYRGTSDEVLQKGAGHLRGSSLPVGGETTHCVVAGHTGLPSVRIFDRLEEVVDGDLVLIEVLGQTLCYRVTGIEVVEPEDTASLRIVDGEDLLTLVTCTPYGINTHRLLVHAERCDLPNDVAASLDAVPGRPDRILLVVLGAAIVALGAAVFVRVRSRRKVARSSHARSGRGND